MGKGIQDQTMSNITCNSSKDFQISLGKYHFYDQNLLLTLAL